MTKNNYKTIHWGSKYRNHKNTGLLPIQYSKGKKHVIGQALGFLLQFWFGFQALT